jgi:hypothetical protein
MGPAGGYFSILTRTQVWIDPKRTLPWLAGWLLFNLTRLRDYLRFKVDWIFQLR